MQFDESQNEDFHEQPDDYIEAFQNEVDQTIVVKKDAVIFLVDCQQSLFKKIDEKEEVTICLLD